ncbi:MAG: helix-turn-helix transcriptional regulator [Candidatus Aminicenantales bacterium]
MEAKIRFPDNPGKALAVCMKKLRAKKGMTQGDIVRATGLERSYVSSLEAGKIKHPRMHTFNKIAMAFGMKLSELIIYCEKIHSKFSPSSS